MSSDAPKSIVEAVRRRFEQAWARGDEPTIESVFPLAADPRFAATLEELVHVDIELRWHQWAGQAVLRQAGQSPPAVESYLRRFPVLRRPPIVARLARTEFEARQRAGQQPSLADYLQRLTPQVLADSAEPTVAPSAAPAADSDPARLQELLQRELASLAIKPPGPTVSVDADATQDFELRKPPAATGPGDDAPKQLAGYEILSRLAEGGMGVVYKARQIGLNRIVALKMIRSGTYAGSDEVARFQREATAVAQLQHPHIVQIFDIGQHGQQPYFSMEFVEGGSLAERLDGQPWKPEAAARFLADVAAAMKFAHARKIIHRDLKPGNILLARRYPDAGGDPPAEKFNSGEWLPKITDFGLAKQLNVQDNLTQSEAILGTPCYMSPEQATGQTAAVGPASDVYSLGAILYELLVGRPPFKADTPILTIRQVATLEPKPPRRLNPAVPADLETICLKCLSKEPANRYPGAAELFADLDRYLIGLPIHARHISRPERAWRWARRNPVQAGLAGAIVAAMLLLGVVVLLTQRAGRLAEVNAIATEFDRRLTDPSTAPAYLEEMDALIDRLGALAPDRVAEAKDRLHRRLAQHLEAEFQAPRLDEGRAADLQIAFESLKKRAPELAKPMYEIAVYTRRRRVLFDYPDGQYVSNVLSKSAVEITPHGAVLRAKESPTANNVELLTSRPSRGDVELDARFAYGWQVHTRQIALVLNGTAADGGSLQGYRFELRMTGPSSQMPPTFAEARKSGGSAQLVISYNHVPLRVQNVAADQLDGALRLRAWREGNLLGLTVNELLPLVHDELFWSPARNQGNFGLSWPPGALLMQLRATEPNDSPRRSPLEKGDDDYSDGRFGEALAHYRSQLEKAADPELRLELRYKQALCLQGLRRDTEAREILDGLVEELGRWSQRAAIHIWASQVEQGQFAQAEETFAALQKRPDFSELAAQIPPSALHKALRHYRDPAGIYGLRPNPDRVRNLRHALDLLTAVKANQQEFDETRTLLIDAHDRNKDLAAAQREAESLLARPDLPVDLRSQIADRLTGLLVRQGDPKAAEACINRHFPRRTPHAGVNEPMLLTRAAFYGSQQKWQDAQDDLEAYFEEKRIVVPKANPRAWLLRGLMARRLDGDLTRARRYWATGYRLACEKGGQDPYLTSVLGLVSGSMTKDDLLQVIQRAAGDGFGMEAVQMVRQGLIGDELIVSVLTSASQRERTLTSLEKQQCFGLPGEETIVRGPRIVAHELFAQMVLGPPPFPRELTPEEDQLLWEFTQTLYDAYRNGEFKEAHLPLLLWAMKGPSTAEQVTGLSGWTVLKSSLSPSCRGPLAFIFACQYERLGLKVEAQELLETAQADAPAGSPLEKVLQVRKPTAD
jgi:tetratricopeptide (TPR) repeat protein